MRVRSSLHKVCKDCKIVKRGRNVYVICSANSRHKQRQGFSTVAAAPVEVAVSSFAHGVAASTFRAVTMQSLASSAVPSVGIISSMGLPSWARVAIPSEDDEGL